MDFPKLLLLTPTRPGEGSVGEIFLRDICRMLPRERVVCFAVTGSGYEIGRPSPDLDWLPMAHIVMPDEKMVPGRFGRRTFPCGRLTRNRFIASAVDEIAQYCQTHGVEAILSVLAGPTMVEISEALVNRTSLDLHTMVWDPIEYILDNLNFEGKAARKMCEQFERVQRRATSCAVASEAMGREYQKLYGTETVVMINGAVPPPEPESVRTLGEESDLVIAFAGTLYAAHEFNSFVDALSSQDFLVCDKNVRLIVMGNIFGVPFTIAGSRANIEILGFRPAQEVVNILAGADLGYLPYWMQARYERAVRLCFPNKLTQYVVAGLPVFYHGPENASPVEFMQRYPMGVRCHSLEKEKILQSLSEFLESESKEQYKAACKHAFETELNKEHFRGSLARLLQVDRAILSMSD